MYLYIIYMRNISADTLSAVSFLSANREQVGKLIIPNPDHVSKFVGENPALTPVGGVCSWTINHGMNSEVVVQVIDLVLKTVVYPEIEIKDNNTVVLKFESAEAIPAAKYSAFIVA